jgi:hypothetical protein
MPSFDGVSMPLKSTSDLADLTGLSREVVGKKLRGLTYESGLRNARMYNSVEALPLLYEVPTDTVDLNQARAKLAEKQVEKIDFDINMKSGSFVPYDVMLSAAQRVFVAFRTRISSIPSKLAPRIAGMTDPVDIEEILEKHLHESLEELSDLREFIEQFDRAPTVVRGGKKS